MKGLPSISWLPKCPCGWLGNRLVDGVTVVIDCG